MVVGALLSVVNPSCWVLGHSAFPEWLPPSLSLLELWELSPKVESWMPVPDNKATKLIQQMLYMLLTLVLKVSKVHALLTSQPPLPNLLPICSLVYQARIGQDSLNSLPSFCHIIPITSALPRMKIPLLKSLPILQALSLETFPHFLHLFIQQLSGKNSFMCNKPYPQGI